MSTSESIIKAITSPLGFFVLALLIIETFLGVALHVNMSEVLKFWIVMIGVGLFAGVVCLVFYLVRFHAANLVFGENSHIRNQELLLGSNLNKPVPQEQLPRASLPENINQ